MSRQTTNPIKALPRPIIAVLMLLAIISRMVPAMTTHVEKAATDAYNFSPLVIILSLFFDF